MGLIGHWRRSVLGAGGVALLLPLGLVLGVALTTALGGETTLRALGQVFAGPAAPTRAGAPGLEAADSVPSVPVHRGDRRNAAALPTGSAPSGPGGAAAPPADRDGAGSGDAARAPVTPDPAPAPDPATPGPAPGPSPGPAPGAGTAPDPNGPVDDAGQAAADAVADAPVVGPAADDAMQTVVDLLP